MKLVSEDPKLRAFSYYSAADYKAVTTSTEEQDKALFAGGIAMLVIGSVFLLVSLFVCKQKTTIKEIIDPTQSHDVEDSMKDTEGIY